MVDQTTIANDYDMLTLVQPLGIKRLILQILYIYWCCYILLYKLDFKLRAECRRLYNRIEQGANNNHRSINLHGALSVLPSTAMCLTWH